MVAASEAVATWPSAEVKSGRSGDGVLSMLTAGYEDLLEAEGKEVGGGVVIISLIIVSSGGVSRASGTREEMPNDVKGGSWSCCCRYLTKGGSGFMFVDWSEAATRSFRTGAAR